MLVIHGVINLTSLSIIKNRKIKKLALFAEQELK